jgi:osmotically inducible protein OsmC
MKRTARAVWEGMGKTGRGSVSTGSGALQEQPYTAFGRFESEDGKAGTNPEELIAAAHAACFTMAASFSFSNAGFTPERLQTDALLTLEKQDIGWTIISNHLTLRAHIPGMPEEQFRELAEKARAGCPISRALKATVTLDARLE